MSVWSYVFPVLGAHEAAVKASKKLGGPNVTGDSPSAVAQRDNLAETGNQASILADRSQENVAALGAEAQAQRQYLKDLSMGRNSVSAEQLRQGLMQQQAQFQSMAAGGAPGSGAMAARNAMMGMGRAGTAFAGNQAMAGLAERNAAQQAWAQAILQARQQDLQAALGARNAATAAYGGFTPEKSLVDKLGPAVVAALGLATGA